MPWLTFLLSPSLRCILIERPVEQTSASNTRSFIYIVHRHVHDLRGPAVLVDDHPRLNTDLGHHVPDCINVFSTVRQAEDSEFDYHRIGFRYAEARFGEQARTVVAGWGGWDTCKREGAAGDGKYLSLTPIHARSNIRSPISTSLPSMHT